jgi:hypothetical protein
MILTLREFVSAEGIVLPPIAPKILCGELPAEGERDLRWVDFEPTAYALELASYAAVVAAYNAAAFRRLKPCLLGRKGLYALFGLRAAAISRTLKQVILAESWPAEAVGLITQGLPEGVALTDLRDALAELSALMEPDSKESPDFGNALAGSLLDALYVLGVLSATERATLDVFRTEPVVATELEAWNELHTWVEGRPT